MLFKRRSAYREDESTKQRRSAAGPSGESTSAPREEDAGSETPAGSSHRSLGSLIEEKTAGEQERAERYRAMLAAMESEGAARTDGAGDAAGVSEIRYSVEPGRKGGETPEVEIRFSKCEATARGVQFEVQALEARRVEIALDVEDWKPVAMAAEPGSAGRWRITKALPRGEFRYKFIIDGQWMNDPLNPLRKPNPFGGDDSIVRVSFGP